MDYSELLSTYWWILVILFSIVFYKFILRVFFGMVIVPENRLGLVTKKFVLFGPNRELPDGRIIATKGEAGFQGKTLAPGLYWGMWPWQYGVDMQPFTVIPEGKIGLVLSNDGAEIPTGAILARRVESENFQNADAFLNNGGQKGRQTSYITSGTYRINTYAFTITVADMIIIHENMVGIVTSLDGHPIESGQIAGKYIDGHNNFQDFDTFLQNNGNRGLQPSIVWQVATTLTHGLYK